MRETDSAQSMIEMNMKEIKDKDVTVVGLARSGVGAANLLHALGARVTVTDQKPEAQLKDYLMELHPSVAYVLGRHPEHVLDAVDLLVVSPGVPLDVPFIRGAKQKGIPVIGEFELAYQVATHPAELGQFHGARCLLTEQGGFLAVTGTNGKSTTTSLLNLMLTKAGYRTIIGGNIGNALTGELIHWISHPAHKETDQTTEPHIDFIVAEVSSFQLESTYEFRPKGAAILNITPDHLDRYHTLKEYCQAKTRIFGQQKEDDFLVLNYDDLLTMQTAKEKLEGMETEPAIFYFSRKEVVRGLYCKDNAILCNFDGALPILPHTKIIDIQAMKISGVHNLENAMAASAMALLAGCPVDTVTNTLTEFPGLEHRLEFVRTVNGVQYFNDSKGTNVGAVMKSLESFTQPVLLIAGGRDKAGDFSLLRQLVKQRVKTLVLIGEARDKMRSALGDIAVTVMANDLEEAVRETARRAEKGDIVLLSPACASFDMFEDFEDRGRQFKRIVQGLNHE